MAGGGRAAGRRCALPACGRGRRRRSVQMDRRASRTPRRSPRADTGASGAPVPGDPVCLREGRDQYRLRLGRSAGVAVAAVLRMGMLVADQARAAGDAADVMVVGYAQRTALRAGLARDDTESAVSSRAHTSLLLKNASRSNR